MEGGNVISTEYMTAALVLKKTTYGAKKTNISPSVLSDLSSLSSILKNPQEWTNFKQLLSFCDYYINYDSMCSGAIKNILIPFSQDARYRFTGGNDKSRIFFNSWLEMNNFEDVLKGLANDYYKYGQTYLYLYDKDYVLQVLPAFRCVVEGISVNGEPVVSFELDKTRKRALTDIEKLERKYGGYPKEVLDAAKKGGQYAQLKTDRVFSVSGTKASWEKYALPIVTSAHPWLIQKEKLNDTQMNELDNMMRGFLEVQVGNKETRPRPNLKEFNEAANAYLDATSGVTSNVAVVAWDVNSTWKMATSKDTLKSISESMAFINWNILSSLSMSPILSAGDASPNKATASNFGTTKAAVGFVNKRINAFLTDVAKMMNKIMVIVGENNGFKPERVPKIAFDLIDLSSDGSISGELLSLYDKGLISIPTLFEHSKYDYNQEFENKQKESEEGLREVFMPPLNAYNMSSSTQAGAPVKDDNSRVTDVDENIDDNMNPRPSSD